MATKKTENGFARTRFKKGRRPHNAKVLEFETIADLVKCLGSERKRVALNGEEVEMTWAERSLRLTVDRALKGNRRDLAQLLRLMIKHPQISGPGRMTVVYFFRGALAKI